MSFLCAHGQKEEIIAHTILAADYDYVCHTSTANDEATDVCYSLTLQVAPTLACTMGYKKHNGENDKEEQLQYVPTTWQNYPQGMMTSIETIPPYRYLTSEKMEDTKWTILSERDSICGYACQKAEGVYGGRKWTVWFAESLPTKFGVWRLNGLPGLILRAVSEDRVHLFECKKVDAIKEPITYSIPNDAIKCARAKFVKLRNKTFGNPNYLSNPTYYIKPAELSNVAVVNGSVILGNIPINMKPVKFQPLDY
ncbi:MAG: GLPGLI family protein [Bacteroides sp.]|nr:GLPGLI family protein [Roseburia sp.]MCM1347240.1 GLPGLI family protein [Bacteroides sp.]MCM1421741.1 GLPGLI family protein [Bacteroides sp.]